MIYTISEYMATAMEVTMFNFCFGFLKESVYAKKHMRTMLSIAFMLLFFSCVTIFNNITIAEGIYAAFYFLIFFMY